MALGVVNCGMQKQSDIRYNDTQYARALRMRSTTLIMFLLGGRGAIAPHALSGERRMVMAAYVIAGVTEVTNPQQMEQYQMEASPTGLMDMTACMGRCLICNLSVGLASNQQQRALLDAPRGR